MGNEIVYCGKCQSRLLSGDFEAGKAVWLSGKPHCVACVMGIVSTLPPEEEQRILEQLAHKRDGEPTPDEPPKRSPLRKTSTARIPIVKTERRTVAAQDPEPNTAVYAILGVGAVLLVGALAAALGSGASVVPRTVEVRHPAAPLVELPRPVPPLTEPGAESTAVRREEAARKALDKARAFGKTNPTDLPGRIALLEEAAWECRDTSLAAEARREHEALQKQRGDLLATELLAATGKALAASGKSQYGEAIDLLGKERSRLAGADWRSAIDQKILQIRQQADQAYAPLREKALQARRRGAEDEVKAMVDRVAVWGVADLSSDLGSALAAIPLPERPLPPDVRSYLGGWENAFASARARDYAVAVRELETAAAALSDPAMKSESAKDLEALRQLAAAYADLLQALSRWPKDQKLTLDLDGAGGTPIRVDGVVTRQGPGWIELKTDGDLVTVDVDELTAGTLRRLLGKLPGRKAEVDLRVGALFLLLGGEPLDGAELPPGALSPRVLAYGIRIAEERSRPETVAREGDARFRFESAEREYNDPATRLQSFDHYRALLASSGDSSFLRRKRALLAQRLESEKEAGKEYVFFAEQMRPAGAFRPSSTPKVASFWMSSADVPPEKDNSVEFTFAARSGLEYRCWVLVGGCCAETFAFDVQGTEMGADPGSAQRVPVKNTILFLKKSHAAHGGRKEPSRFEWVAVPLPKYPSGGPKTVRLLSTQQGFAVGMAVVSASRTAPPADVQVKEWEKARPTLVAPVVTRDAGLVAWWTFDEGSGGGAADSSSNRLSGVLRNDPVWTSGKRRGALSFDGQNAYVEIPKDPRLYFAGPFTVAAWVNIAALPKSEWGMYVVSDYVTEGDRCTFSLRVMSSGSAQFFWQTEPAEHGHANSTGRLAPGAWTHLAGVWDGTSRTLYINGVPDGTSTAAQGRPDKRGNVSIGRPGSFNGLYFNGRIDDVRLYGRALSTAEVRALAGR